MSVNIYPGEGNKFLIRKAGVPDSVAEVHCYLFFFFSIFFSGRLLFAGYHDYTMNVWDTLKVCENHHKFIFLNSVQDNSQDGIPRVNLELACKAYTGNISIPPPPPPYEGWFSFFGPPSPPPSLELQI